MLEDIDAAKYARGQQQLALQMIVKSWRLLLLHVELMFPP
jgi:hypothetical protein